MLLYLVALQCVATVTTIEGVTASGNIAWDLFVGYGLLAYFIAWIAAIFI
jgi:ferrous iron transport protein B|tara:strand:- start:680 stop:829 length:150 start_codon:yes stop_codon:yes gene_type:complete